MPLETAALGVSPDGPVRATSHVSRHVNRRPKYLPANIPSFGRDHRSSPLPPGRTFFPTRSARADLKINRDILSCGEDLERRRDRLELPRLDLFAEFARHCKRQAFVFERFADSVEQPPLSGGKAGASEGLGRVIGHGSVTGRQRLEYTGPRL